MPDLLEPEAEIRYIPVFYINACAEFLCQVSLSAPSSVRRVRRFATSQMSQKCHGTLVLVCSINAVGVSL